MDSSECPGRFILPGCLDTKAQIDARVLSIGQAAIRPEVCAFRLELYAFGLNWTRAGPELDAIYLNWTPFGLNLTPFGLNWTLTT